MEWYNIKNDKVELRIFAKPNARQSAITGVNENGLCVALKAKPVEGEANKELLNFLSKKLGIAKTQILLLKGEGSRHKLLSLPLNDSLKELIDSFSR